MKKEKININDDKQVLELFLISIKKLCDNFYRRNITIFYNNNEKSQKIGFLYNLSFTLSITDHSFENENIGTHINSFITKYQYKTSPWYITSFFNTDPKKFIVEDKKKEFYYNNLLKWIGKFSKSRRKKLLKHSIILEKNTEKSYERFLNYLIKDFNLELNSISNISSTSVKNIEKLSPKQERKRKLNRIFRKMKGISRNDSN